MYRHAAVKFIFVLFVLSGCASTEEVDSSTAEGGFKLAQRFEKDERFEEALAYYANIKNKFPYSKYAVESELRIANINYNRESYIEAEGAYRLFKEFHPKHAKIDFVTFRLGMSVFKQLPDSIDRDLSLAEKAILHFDEVIRSYPSSDYVGSARDHKRKALRMLGEKEYYIGHFYMIRDKFDSARGRFANLLDKYPGLGLNAKALYGAAYSSVKLKDKDNARKYYERLLSLHPKSKEARKAKQELKDEL